MTLAYKIYLKKSRIRETKTLSTNADSSIDTKKSRIRETKHLLINADSSTDTTVGWTKNTKKPIFFEKLKNYPKLKNSKCLEICQN